MNQLNLEIKFTLIQNTGACLTIKQQNIIDRKLAPLSL